MKKIVIIFLILSSLISSAQVDSVEYYRKKARSFEYKHFDSMFYYSNKIHRIATQQNNTAYFSQYHAVVGVALEEMGNYDSAEWHQEQSLELALEVLDSNLISMAYQHLGVIYRDRGDFDLAVESFFNSLRISVSIGKYYTESMSYLGLSQVQHKMGNYQEAIKYAEDCIKAGKDHGDNKAASAGMIELGNNLVMLGKFDEAIGKFKEAEVLLKELDVKDGLASIYNSIGAVFFYKGDLEEAIRYYTKSVDFGKESENLLDQAVGILNIGEAHIYLKNYDLAQSNLQKAIQMLKTLGNKGFIASGYQYLYDLEKSRGDYKQALQYFELNDAYQDSIINERNLNQISALKIEYETEKKEQQLEILQTQQELQQAEIDRSKYLIWGISSFSLIAMIAIILFFSRQRYKLKAVLAEEKEQLQKTRFKAVIDAEEKERKRIAQELHDGLGQLLSTARITVSSLDELKNPKVTNSLKVIDMAVKEVRSISHNMMPNALVNVGLKAALEDVMRKVNESGSVQGIFEWPGEIVLDESQSISLYRIVQELINNALKYAKASQVKLGVHQKEGFLVMTVADNGEGFDTSTIDQSTGIGWANIQSRVDLIGASLDVNSSKQGTNVKITIKLSQFQQAG